MKHEQKEIWSAKRRELKPTIKEFINSYSYSVGGVFAGNTHEECAGVHRGVPIVYILRVTCIYLQYYMQYQNNYIVKNL